MNAAAQTVTQPVEQATQPAAAVVEPASAPAPAPAPDLEPAVEAAASAATPAAPVTRTVENAAAPVASTVQEAAAPVTRTVENAVAPVASTVQEAAAPVAETAARTVEAAAPIVASTANVVDDPAGAMPAGGPTSSTGGPRGSDLEAQAALAAPAAVTPTSDPGPGSAASGSGPAAVPDKRSAPTPRLRSDAATVAIGSVDLSAALAAAERLLPIPERRTTRAPVAPVGDPPDDQLLLGSPSSVGVSPGVLFAAFAVLATLMSLAIPPLGRRLALSPALAPPGMLASPLERPG